MIKVAAVQAAPVWMDAAATTEKTIELLKAAATHDVKLVAFGQSWLPGYPWQTRLHPFTGSPPPGIDRFRENAVALDGPEMAMLCSAAADLSLHVVLGIAERAGSDVFATHVHITSAGETAYRRRATVRNMLEQRAWVDGQVEAPAVRSTELGNIGSLDSADNLERELQHELFGQGEQIHIALWTAFCLPTNALPVATARASAQHYATENECYVLMATQVTPQSVCEQVAAGGASAMPMMIPGGGAAAVFAPDGRQLTNPIPETDDGLAIAEIDLAQVAAIPRSVRKPLRERGDALSEDQVPPVG